MKGSLEVISWDGERRELGEYPDLSWDLDSRMIYELVERLCVVGVKPHYVCLPV